MTDNPFYRAALEAAAVVPAMAAPGHWLVSDVDRIHDAILALPVPSLRGTLAAMVQPLEWVDGRAVTTIGIYRIGYRECSQCPIDIGVVTFNGERIFEKHGAVDDDLAVAAQADYTRRILAALGVKE